ncbi:hypothetical protein F5888DRAFT_1747426 [Russula emetica]|nr:hypothetical protein F5888DRAFT_1747426 [Russula emetica]
MRMANSRMPTTSHGSTPQVTRPPSLFRLSKELKERLSPMLELLILDLSKMSWERALAVQSQDRQALVEFSAVVGEGRWLKPSSMRRLTTMVTQSNASRPSLCARLENLAKSRSNTSTQQTWEPPRMKMIVTTRTPNLQSLNLRAHHPRKATVKIRSHLMLRSQTSYRLRQYPLGGVLPESVHAQSQHPLLGRSNPSAALRACAVTAIRVKKHQNQWLQGIPSIISMRQSNEARTENSETLATGTTSASTEMGRC